MPTNEKVQALYNQLTKDGYNIGDYNTFSSKLDNPEKVKSLYDGITKDGYTVGDYNTFSSKIAGTHSSIQQVKPLTDNEAKKTIYGGIPGVTKIGDVSMLPTGGGYQNTKGKASVQELPTQTKEVAVPAQSVYGDAPQLKVQTATGNDRTAKEHADSIILPPEALEELEKNRVAVQVPGGGMFQQPTVVYKDNEELKQQLKDYYAFNPEGKAKYEQHISTLTNAESAIEKADTDLSKREELFQKERHKLYSGLYSGTEKEYAINDKEKRLLDAERSKINSAKKAVQSYKEGKNSNFLQQFAGEFGRGFGNMIEDVASWGVAPMLNSLQYHKLIKKQQQGEKLTSDEEKALSSSALSNYINKTYSGEKTFAQDLASGIEQSVPYMTTFVTTGGLAKTITGGLAKTTIKDAAIAGLRGTEKGITKSLAKTLGVLNNVANATAQAGMITVLDPRTYNQAIQNLDGEAGFEIDKKTGKILYTGQKEGMDFSGALTRAITSSMIENSSEFAGEAFAPISKLIKKFTTSKLPQVANILFNNNKFYTGVNDLMKAAKWNGTVGEFMEEQLATIGHSLSGDGQAQWSDLTDPRSQALTLANIMAIGSGTWLANTAGNEVAKYQTINEYKKAESRFNSIFGESGASIKNIFINGSIEDKNGLLNYIVSDEKIPNEQKQATWDYFVAATRYGAYNTTSKENADENSIYESIISPIIPENVDVMNPQQHIEAGISAAEAKRVMDQQLEGLGITFDDTVLTLDTEAKKQVLEDVMNDAQLNDPQKQSIINYLSATSRSIQLENAAQSALNEKIQQAPQQVAQQVNPTTGTIVTARIKGDDENAVFKVVSGLAVTNTEDGDNLWQIDADKSETTVFYEDAEGKRFPTTADNMEVVSNTTPDEQLAMLQEQYAQEEAMRQQAILEAVSSYQLSVNSEQTPPPSGTPLERGDLKSQVSENGDQAVANPLVNVPIEELESQLSAIDDALESGVLSDQQANELLKQREVIQGAVSSHASTSSATTTSSATDSSTGSLTTPKSSAESRTSSEGDLNSQVSEKTPNPQMGALENQVSENAGDVADNADGVTSSNLSKEGDQGNTVIPQYPVLEDGTPDFNAMSDEQTFNYLKETEGEESAISAIKQVVKNTQTEIQTNNRAIEKFNKEKYARSNKAKTLQDIARIKTSLKSEETKLNAKKAELEQRLKDLNDLVSSKQSVVTTPKSPEGDLKSQVSEKTPNPTPKSPEGDLKSQVSENIPDVSESVPVREKQKSTQVNPWDKRLQNLGEYLDVEDYVLRAIAGGMKFKWTGDGINKGLGDELGLTTSTKEKTARRNMLSDNGITPQEFAHAIWDEYGGENNNGRIPGLDKLESQDILNFVLDVANSTQTKSEALKKSEEKHNNLDLNEEDYSIYQSFTPEELNYLEQIPDEILSSYLGITNFTPEQLDLITNLQNEYHEEQRTKSQEPRFDQQPTSTGTGERSEGIAEEQSAVSSQQSAVVYKRLSEPSKPISEMNSEEVYKLAVENQKLLKQQDKQFEGKTELEKERGGYYNVFDDVSELKDTSTKLNFVENAEDLDELTISTKSVLDEIKNNTPNDYQLAILNAIQNKSSELGISTSDLIISVAKKISSQYKDSDDAMTMVRSLFDKISNTSTVDDQISLQEHNTNPTELQKLSGGYEKPHIIVNDMPIQIEKAIGHTRSGVDEDGKAWEHVMKSHYGDFIGTKGYDGDPIDVFIKSNTPEDWNGMVYVVDQVNPASTSLSNHASDTLNNQFDESKVMIGYDTPEEAKDAYMENYDPDWKGFSAITPVAVSDFKKWLYDGAKQRKPFSEYVENKPLTSAESRTSSEGEQDDAVSFQINPNEIIKNNVSLRDDYSSEEEKHADRVALVRGIESLFGFKESYVPTSREDFIQKLSERTILNEREKVVINLGLVGGSETSDGIIINAMDAKTEKALATTILHENAHAIVRENFTSEDFYAAKEYMSELEPIYLNDFEQQHYTEDQKADEIMAYATQELLNKNTIKDIIDGNVDFSAVHEQILPQIQKIVNTIQNENNLYQSRNSQIGSKPDGRRVSGTSTAFGKRKYPSRPRKNEGSDNRSSVDASTGSATTTSSATRDTIDVDGKQRSTTNSLGKPIHGTEEGIRNFWKWFGDSKVVDESGRPLVVYHGSRNGEFNVFDMDNYGKNGVLSGKGFNFSANKKVANNYGKTGSVMPVYLKSENPFYGLSNLDETTKNYLLHTEGDWDDIVKSAGFDSRTDKDFNLILVYDPTQIKSATGNDGSFSPDTSDIRYQILGEKGAEMLDTNDTSTEGKLKAKENVMKSVIDKYINSGKISELYTPLTEKEFFKKFKSQHKNLTTTGDKSVMDNIINNGFNKGRNVNSLPIWKGSEKQTDVISSHYGQKKGDQIYLLPKEATKETPNGLITLQGYKPNREDIVNIDYDRQPIYEAYLNNFKNAEVVEEIYKYSKLNGQNIEFTSKLDAEIQNDLNASTDSTSSSNEANTRLDDLRVAKEMEATKTPIEIRLATGWEKGVDGKWRYEVADGKLSSTLTSEPVSLSEVWSDEQLFTAYPQLKDIKINAEPFNGKYSAMNFPDENKITVYQSRGGSIPQSANSFITHEIQHSIQEIEGFSLGSNIDVEIDKVNAKANNLTFEEYKDAISSFETELENKKQELGQINNSKRWNKSWKAAGVEVEINKLKAELKKLVNTTASEQEAFDNYRKSAGEVEARNVQSRLELTPEERRNTLLAETADVAPEDQVILRESVPSAQILGEKGAEELDASTGSSTEGTTRLDNLRVAKEMEATKTALEIRLATGWEKGVDGLWRYEVPDGELAYGYYDLIQKGGMKRLSDVFENTEIFKAYPELNNIAVITDNIGNISGSYSNKIITLNRDKFGKIDMLSVLIHEIQHVIQEIEGFAKGGNTAMAESKLKETKSEKEEREAIQEISSFAQFIGNSDFNSPEFKNIINNLSEGAKTYLNNFKKNSLGLSLKQYSDVLWNDFNTQKSEKRKPFAYEYYKSLSGEVEARNAQTRMNMTDDERKNTLLSETADVTPENQIITTTKPKYSASLSDYAADIVKYNDEIKAIEDRKKELKKQHDEKQISNLDFSKEVKTLNEEKFDLETKVKRIEAGTSKPEDFKTPNPQMGAKENPSASLVQQTPPQPLGFATPLEKRGDLEQVDSKATTHAEKLLIKRNAAKDYAMRKLEILAHDNNTPVDLSLTALNTPENISHNLEVAKTQEKNGTDGETVLNTTGWMKNEAGTWEFPKYKLEENELPLYERNFYEGLDTYVQKNGNAGSLKANIEEYVNHINSLAREKAIGLEAERMNSITDADIPDYDSDKEAEVLAQAMGSIDELEEIERKQANELKESIGTSTDIDFLMQQLKENRKKQGTGITTKVKTVAQEVSDYIRVAVGKDIVDVMSEREFKSLINKLETATSTGSLRTAMKAVNQTIQQIVVRKNRAILRGFVNGKILNTFYLYELDAAVRTNNQITPEYSNLIDNDLMNTLSNLNSYNRYFEIQGKNKQGVSIAKNVDEGTRQIMQFVRDYKDFSREQLAKLEKELEENRNELNASAGSATTASTASAGSATTVTGATAGSLENIAKKAIEANTKRALLQNERKQMAIEQLKRLADIKDIEADIKILKETDWQDNAFNEKTKWEIILDRQKDLESSQMESIRNFASLLDTGRSLLTQWKEAEQKHNDEIAAEALSAVTEKAVKTQAQEKAKPTIKNRSLLSTWWRTPLTSFEFMLSNIDRNHPTGEGPMYRRWMPELTQASDKFYNGYNKFRSDVKQAVQDIFGMKLEDFTKDTRKDSGMSITYASTASASSATDATAEQTTETIPMTKGELMYVWLTWQHTDGREKLEAMSITENDINKIAETLGDNYIEFAKWTQNHLNESREKYNETHNAVFGTSMGKIQNYFPLKYAEKDLTPQGTVDEINPSLPSTMTGAIINRVRTKKQIKLDENFLDTLMEHGEKMESWNAYAKLRKDLNVLLKNKEFRNRMEANNTGLFEDFENAAKIAVDANQPRPTDVETAFVNVTRRLQGAAIAGRINTALKQSTAAVSYVFYNTDPKYYAMLAKNLRDASQVAKTIAWAKENLPTYAERVGLGNFGNEKLLLDRWENSLQAAGKDKRTGKVGRAINKVSQAITEKGMLPNKWVDGFIFASGSHAIYEYEKQRYVKAGFSDSEAEQRALFDAANYSNKVSQSSNPAYLAPVQKSKTWWAQTFTTFMNSQFAFGRNEHEGITQLYRAAKQIPILTSENEAAGMSPEEAKKHAQKTVLNANGKAVLKILYSGFIANFIFQMFDTVFSSIISGGGGNDEDEIQKKIINAAWKSLLSNIFGGSNIISVIEGYDPKSLLDSETSKAVRELKSTVKDGFSAETAKLAIQYAIKFSLGLNVETLANIYTGIEKGIIEKGGAVMAYQYITNVPKSIREETAKNKLIPGESIVDFAKRISDAKNAALKDSDLKEVILKKVYSDNGDMTKFNRLNELATEWEKLQRAEKDSEQHSDRYNELKELNKTYTETDMYGNMYEKYVLDGFYDNVSSAVKYYKKAMKNGNEIKAEEMETDKKVIDDLINKFEEK